MSRQIAVVVDMQNDFMKGALRVPGAMELIKPILEICRNSDYVIATRDWHPTNHKSFKENGGEWPKHCVKGSVGAKTWWAIDRRAHIVVSKGYEFDKEGYSAAENPAFFDALYAVYADWKDTVVVCGVALDYCVKTTAIDIVRRGGFKNVIVPEKATKAVNQDPLSLSLTIKELEDYGVVYKRF